MDEDDDADRAHQLADLSVTPWHLVGSTLGNAFYSGLTLEQVWSCYSESLTLEQFDTAVNAQAELHDIEVVHKRAR